MVRHDVVKRVIESSVACFRRHSLTHEEMAVVLNALVECHMVEIARASGEMVDDAPAPKKAPSSIIIPA